MFLPMPSCGRLRWRLESSLYSSSTLTWFFFFLPMVVYPDYMWKSSPELIKYILTGIICLELISVQWDRNADILNGPLILSKKKEHLFYFKSWSSSKTWSFSNHYGWAGSAFHLLFVAVMWPWICLFCIIYSTQNKSVHVGAGKRA